MHITPLGWAGIIFLVVVTLVLNLALFALLRNPTRFKVNRPPRTQTGMTVHKLGEVIRDPFGEEKRQMNELSHLVEDLKESEKDE
jgi:hypothetical protein